MNPEDRFVEGDSARCARKGVEGVVEFSDPVARQIRFVGGGRSQFYSWDECEIVAKTGGDVVPASTYRTDDALVDDAKLTGAGPKKLGAK